LPATAVRSTGVNPGVLLLSCLFALLPLVTTRCFAIAPQSPMLHTRAASQRVERDIEHMNRFAVRQMEPQHPPQPGDTSCDFQLSHELLHDTDPARRESPHQLRQFQLNRYVASIGDSPFQVAWSIRVATRRYRDLSRFRALCFVRTPQFIRELRIK
jgi:hypothetical protein